MKDISREMRERHGGGVAVAFASAACKAGSRRGTRRGDDQAEPGHLERFQRASVERYGQGGATGVSATWLGFRVDRSSTLSFVSTPDGGCAPAGGEALVAEWITP